MAGLLLLWLVIEDLCEDNSGEHVAVFSDNHPTVLWVDRLASKSSVIAVEFLRALAIRLRIKGALPLTPFHIDEKQNDMKDIIEERHG